MSLFFFLLVTVTNFALGFGTAVWFGWASIRNSPPTEGALSQPAKPQ